MLAVSIEGDERIRALLESVVDASLQRGALSEVNRMPKDDRACEQRGVAGAVAGAVIDHDDRVSGAANAGHDATDHGRFIVRRDNDPGIANPAGHVRLVSRAGGVLLKTTRIASNRFTGMANRLPVGLVAILRPSMRPTWKAISENGTNFQG